MNTLAENAHENDIEQLRARLAGLESEVIQLKARPASPTDAESMLENATDGFLVYDSEFQFTYLNGDAERLLGKSKTELLGKTQWDVFPETIGTEIERQYRRAMKERVASVFDYFFRLWSRGSRSVSHPQPWEACWSGFATSPRAGRLRCNARDSFWQSSLSGKS